MMLIRIATALYLMEATLAARILGVFPTPSISHQVVFRALTLELARRGHELVVLTTDPARHHPNITQIDAHDVSYPLWDELFMKKIFEAERKEERSLLEQYRLFMRDVLVELLDAEMSLPEMQLLIKSESEHFDLILVESLARPAFAFRHKFKAPVIAVSSTAATGFTYDAIGVPTHPLLYSNLIYGQTTGLSLIKRIETIFFHLYTMYYDAAGLKVANAFARRLFGEDTPDIAELEAQTDMLFLNVNPIWDGIKATPPNVFYMWGTHLEPPKELPNDLKKFLDSSENGVVYMSLGSNMKSTALSADRLSVFLETFRRLPYDVLWKWEADELPGKPDNVRIEKWLPQADLLRHPNLKAFITQGGLQSTDEALSAGVPLIGIPIFGDQAANTERYVTHGVGVALDIKTLTAAILKEAVTSVVGSEKYRAAVQRMARLLADEGVAGGVERAAWWVEYVIRHGGAQHLRSPAAGVSAAEYFMLDVVATLTLITFIVLKLAVAAFSYMFNVSKRIRFIKKRKNR